MRSPSGDSVGVELGAVSFRTLLQVLGRLPGAKIGKANQNPMNDDASAAFEYKGLIFQVYTPLSDHWIDRPLKCPAAVFEEVVHHLEATPVRWWQRIL